METNIRHGIGYLETTRQVKKLPFCERYRSTVEKALGCDFSNVEMEYSHSKENELMKAVWALDMSERRLLILYAELSSFREVAKLYNCSEGAIRNKMKTIRKKFEYLKHERYEFISESDSDCIDNRIYCRSLRSNG